MDPDEESGGTEPPPERTWVHPSELGHSTRMQRDHRLSRRLLLGVVAVAAGAWLASAIFTSIADTASGTKTHSMAEPHVLMVQPTDDDASPATAVVVDNAGHLAVSSNEFLPNTTVRVLCGGRYRSATVVEHDSDSGLAILELDDPYGSPSNPASVEVGDPVNVVAFSPDGTRAMQQATVASGLLESNEDANGQGLSGGAMTSASVASTTVSSHTAGSSPQSPASAEPLRVMAIKSGNVGESRAVAGSAVTASGGKVVGLVVAEGPVAGMVEPLDEVKRRAATMLGG